MKHGIYYSYWEHEWSAKFGPYVEKVAKLGFDVIEVAAHHINDYSDAELATIKQSARDNGIILTAGIVGPSKSKNLSSPDKAVRRQARRSSRRR